MEADSNDPRMEFLFRHRGAGKRQVKPSQDIALLEDQIGAESSDDSEYKVDSDHEQDDNDHSNSSNAEDSEDNGDDVSEEDEIAEAEVSVIDEVGIDCDSLTTKQLLALARQELVSHDQLPKWVENVKVCGCCLGQASSDANEIVECDGCGISVHEGCYGISESAGSIASTVSSASTEPWFCEPCRAGLDYSPNCEFCPIVGGVYKQTDVGRWIHLICALYVPGVAFGDPEKMTKVTIFEMNYVNWGRRVCSICSSTLTQSYFSGGARLSRTGVCIHCDAGLCKSYFHVSCAQAAGLLSEPTYVTSNNVTHTAEAVMDAYLAHCKVHTDRTVIKRRRRAYLLHLVQSRLRRQAILLKRASSKKEDIETADERILRKLARSQVHYRSERSRGHEVWVPTQKLPRLLSTSASAIRKLQKVAEMQGVDQERQTKQEIQVMSLMEVKKKWGVAPAFNIEFVAYYEDREKRIAELKNKVSQDKMEFEKLKQQDSEVTLKYDAINKIVTGNSELNSSLRKRFQTFRQLLSMGGHSLPEAVPPVILSKPVNSSEASVSIKARSTAYSSQIGSQVSKHLKTCGVCGKSHDQHLLAHCDTCKLYYHLGCLTPPLTRMPKKSKLYGWSCSECYPDSSGDEQIHTELEDLSSDAMIRKRRENRRVAASKALLMATSSADNSDEELKEALKKSAKLNGIENQQREKLIAKAAEKAERKRKRKEDKARRKAERKAEKKRKLEEEDHLINGDNEENAAVLFKNNDSDIEIIEDENGVCKTIIQPKPIKLTIKTNGHHSTPPAAAASTTTKRAPKDVRTQCDKCGQPGDNTSLVRCDECKRCFHFACLIPPLRKSPKVPGYGWHCNECDPSDQDSDWHL